MANFVKLTKYREIDNEQWVNADLVTHLEFDEARDRCIISFGLERQTVTTCEGGKLLLLLAEPEMEDYQNGKAE
jgi:hypothetical protein